MHQPPANGMHCAACGEHIQHGAKHLWVWLNTPQLHLFFCGLRCACAYADAYDQRLRARSAGGPVGANEKYPALEGKRLYCIRSINHPDLIKWRNDGKTEITFDNDLREDYMHGPEIDTRGRVYHRRKYHDVRHMG